MDQFPGAFPDRLAAAEFLEFEVQIVVLPLAFLAGQQGKEADPVHSFHRRRSRQFPERGHQVPEGAREIRLGARLDVPGPGHDHRHADTAFVNIAFVPPPGAVAVEKVRVRATFPVRPVVTAEKEDCVLVQAQFLELVHQLADIDIQSGDHRGEGRMGLLLGDIISLHEVRAVRPGAVVGRFWIPAPQPLEDAVLRDDEFRVWNCRRIPQEEGFSVRRSPVQEGQRLLVDQVRGISTGPVGIIAPVHFRQVDADVIGPQMVRVIAVRQQLAVEAVEGVHALRLRVAGRAHETEAPFAEGARGVAGGFEIVEQRLRAFRQWELPFGLEFPVAADGRMPAVGAGDEAGP